MPHPTAAVLDPLLDRALACCHEHGVDLSPAGAQAAHAAVQAAQRTGDRVRVAAAADHLAVVATGRAEFDTAVQAREMAESSSTSRRCRDAVRVARERDRLADEHPVGAWDTRDVMRVATRAGRVGARPERDLVLLVREATRTCSTEVLAAAAGTARGCAEPAIAFALLARSLTLNPSVAENPAAFVTLTSLLDDRDARALRPLARDLGAALEYEHPDDVAVHRVALVTWKQLDSRDEIRRHARAIERLTAAGRTTHRGVTAARG